MNWVRATVWAIGLAAVVGIVAAMIAVNRPAGQDPKVDGPALEARVVRIGTIPSRWQMDKVLVVASTPDGRTGQGVLALARLNKLDCKVGDPVSAHMVGSVLVVDALTCGTARSLSQ